eukprot:6710487-Ditylum_brightwellii.AAC.1
MDKARSESSIETNSNEKPESLRTALVAATGLLCLCNVSFDSVTTTQHANGFQSQKEKRTLTFPERLMKILSTDGVEDMITWLPHGHAFTILHKKAVSLGLRAILTRDIPPQGKQWDLCCVCGSGSMLSMATIIYANLMRTTFDVPTLSSLIYVIKWFQRDNASLCLRMRCVWNKKPAVATRQNPKHDFLQSAQCMEKPSTYHRPPEDLFAISRCDLDEKAFQMTPHERFRSAISLPMYPRFRVFKTFPRHFLAQPTSPVASYGTVMKSYSSEASCKIISAALDALDRSEPCRIANIF